MDIKTLQDDARTRMHASVEAVRRELSQMRTGRASLAMIDGIRVDYYGTPTPLNQVGNLSIPDPTLITIQPWEVSLIGAIEKAVRSAGLDLNPQNDGKLIRIPVPQLTEERRKLLVKTAHKHAEEGRVAIRNVRRKAKEQLDRMIKDGDSGEDEVRRAEKELDDTTHKYVSVVDELVKHKEAELLEV